MHIGHRNSGIVFQKIVDSTLRKGLENIFQVYLDDIIGGVEKFEQINKINVINKKM